LHRRSYRDYAKLPGLVITTSGVGMTFKYEDYFEAAPSTGYETLIYDCMIGDALLFQRADEVEAAWRAVQPFLDAWRNAGPGGLAVYKAGSEGPAEADQLLAVMAGAGGPLRRKGHDATSGRDSSSEVGAALHSLGGS
jgi:glucose-6-phosphate 1-dehydrogenase